MYKKRSISGLVHLSRLFRPTTALVLVLGLQALSVPQAVIAQTKLSQETQGSEQKLNAKKMITHDVYANWRSIQNTQLSRDGQWAAYALVGQESDGEIVVRNLIDGREWRAPRGHSPVFSADGRYVAFARAPSRIELDKAKKDKVKTEDAPKAGVGVMQLQTGHTEMIERVKRFSFPEDGQSLLAVLLEAPKEVKKSVSKENDGSKDHELLDEAFSDWGSLDDDTDQSAPNPAANIPAKKKDVGTELIIWNLAENKKQSIKDVWEAVWNKSGSALAYSISLKDQPTKEPTKEVTKTVASTTSGESASIKTEPVEKADPLASEGIYLWTSSTQQTRSLLIGAGSYKHLRFDEQGEQFAVLSNRDQVAKKKKATDAKTTDANLDTNVFQLYYWNLSSGKEWNVNADSLGMQKAWAPSEHGDLVFSKDGQRLFFSTAEIPKTPIKNAPEPMKVDLWHWKDPELQSMQKANAERDRQKNYRAVLHLADGKFVQLANKLIPQIIVNDNAQFAMGISSLPYRQLLSWDSLHYDAYAIDLQSGQAKMLLEKARFMPQISPSGKYLLNFEPEKSAWWAYSTIDGKKSNLTSHIKTHFEDEQRDTPEPKNAFGVAGWTADDESVVLYDQFDLWEVKLASKSARNLSAGFGRKNQLELRYLHLGDSKQSPITKPLNTDQAWILSATHDVNQSTGYYRIDPRAAACVEPQKLMHADKHLSNLMKAKEGDAVLLTQQTFTEFPDLWQTDLSFKNVQRISNANPQQADYQWGTQEMIEYISADGKKLRALIAKPENFDPKKKYPMMVYIYEKMTDNMYRYVTPAPGQNINVARYVSNGYIVLRPDIVYKTGYPGKSALDTVVPAVKQVIAKGYVDPKRVGIQGHSWGAYQINYLLTRTNIFRAAEAGASMANMISGYGGIRWGAGISRAFQYERGQSRIGGTPWDSTSKYVENSPIFAVDKVQTPFLTVHNDDDDAVPWYQAIEFFSALRRLNKEAYWFNYNGEKHGLRDRDNIKHFTVHMGEFFDHYLLNKPRPDWMDIPIPYLERGKRDVMGQFIPAKIGEKSGAKSVEMPETK
ncbi:S9 family peptidase [Undibacterium fentianense]|uniref:S9 family peptidase n=1 Tax=Undibacterium fentianense TaxID=2828728 RepID=A0A941E6K9_9BURK|nr:prolyl oligopeptidase family serine peptidase [Undibacterium fentianense]MBR7799673.1 S9 family peptidase [Undibacterium fentianense]